MKIEINSTIRKHKGIIKSGKINSKKLLPYVGKQAISVELKEE